VCMCTYMFVYHRVYSVACCSDSDLLVRYELGNRSFGFMFVVHSIHWRFEDRSMGWSEDPYRLMQWRPDVDSVPKPRHFMWVFALISFPYLLLSVLTICYLYYFMWPSDIFYQYDYPYRFIWCQWVYTLSIQFIWTLISVISCDG